MPQNESNNQNPQFQQPYQQPPQYQPPPPYYGMMPPEDYGQSPKKKGSFDVSNILMVAVVAGVLAYGVLRVFAPTLTQYKADITRLENDLVSIRANYALTSSVPNVSALNTRIATVETGVNEAKTAITNAQNELDNAISALQNQIDTIPQYNATPLQTAIAANAASIDAINIEIETIKQQVGDIEPADLSAIEIRLDALDASIATINTSLTTIQDSIGDITATIPSVYISNLATGYSGLQAIITSNRTCYALVTIRYTFSMPCPAATVMPPLTVLPYGAVYLGNYTNISGTNIIQSVWSARVLVNAGDNAVQWYPATAIPVIGTWSVSVEVSQ